jgi:hypothetical protein
MPEARDRKADKNGYRDEKQGALLCSRSHGRWFGRHANRAAKQGRDPPVPGSRSLSMGPIPVPGSQAA